MPERAARAERILDAAAELLLRWGYRRTTVDDVAKQAGIGKGTIYLHWRTREELFQAVLVRESARYLRVLLDEIAADPAAVLPNRMVRIGYLAVMRNPLMRAMLVGDEDLLGSLVSRDGSVVPTAVRMLEREGYDRAIADGRLLRGDLSPELEIQGLTCTIMGFYLIDTALPGGSGMGLETTADVLAHIVRNAFETRDTPSEEELTRIAGEVSDFYERTHARCLDHVRTGQVEGAAPD
ncbi:TetR/AcrR family transcriptional regulator [Allokutzneria albata]|uniref:DNA-binding transcriptional regulator, AcrR family n=1 Tax=Allokutzneria albata TaxID=211114 RepID=A0A1G9XA47_ALLAB|nr:TetR/AcrR family transcriptional regulator [Allokutzneria albata]SDM93608.1 DNA-binding transcriptional regulator, AcrR family [Allokutzneria albata]